MFHTLEPENHLFEKENHLNQSSILWVQNVNFPVCIFYPKKLGEMIHFDSEWKTSKIFRSRVTVELASISLPFLFADQEKKERTGLQSGRLLV